MSELGIKALDKYKLQVELKKTTCAKIYVYNGPFKVINWQVEIKFNL